MAKQKKVKKPLSNIVKLQIQSNFAIRNGLIRNHFLWPMSLMKSRTWAEVQIILLGRFLGSLCQLALHNNHVGKSVLCSFKGGLISESFFTIPKMCQIPCNFRPKYSEHKEKKIRIVIWPIFWWMEPNWEKLGEILSPLYF